MVQRCRDQLQHSCVERCDYIWFSLGSQDHIFFLMVEKIILSSQDSIGRHFHLKTHTQLRKFPVKGRGSPHSCPSHFWMEGELYCYLRFHVLLISCGDHLNAHFIWNIEAQEILGEQPGSKTGKERGPVKQGPWAGAWQVWGFIPGWGFQELVTSTSDVSTWNVRGEYLWCVSCHPPVTETSGKAEPPQDPAEKQAGTALRVEALPNSSSSGGPAVPDCAPSVSGSCRHPWGQMPRDVILLAAHFEYFLQWPLEY